MQEGKKVKGGRRPRRGEGQANEGREPRRAKGQ